MASYYLSPVSAIFQYFTDAGIVLNGGKVNTYLAGTTTPTTTWADITGVTPNANPITLLSNGRLPNEQIWQLGGVPIKIIVTDSSGNQLGPTFDQISGINDPAVTMAALASSSAGQGADLVANVMRSYDIISSVRAGIVPALSAGQSLIICIEGASSPTDGKGGLFYWNATSSATDDGLNVIKPTAEGGNGRYLRLVQSVSGSFTGTFTGFTTTVTATVQYRIYNNIAYLFFNTTNPSGTSNTTAMTMTGLPSLLNPTVDKWILCCTEDNGNLEQFSALLVSNAGVCTFQKYSVGSGNFSSAGFTASGVKGLAPDWFVSYPLS